MRFPRVTLLTFALLALAPVLGAQSHEYRLNGTLADTYGGPSLVADGGQLTLTGYTFAANQGLSLSDVFTGGSYSIVFRSMLSRVDGYRKLVDFKNRTSDNGYYNYYTEADFYPQARGPLGGYFANVMATTVLTHDVLDDRFAVYVNGILQLSFIDGGKLTFFDQPNNIARFFEDDFESGPFEASGGTVNYLATYDSALTADQVAELELPIVTPEPATVVLLAGGLAGVAGITRRRRRA